MTPKPIFRLWARLLFAHGEKIALTLTFLSIALGGWVYQHVSSQGIPLDFTPQSIFLDNGEMVRHLRSVEEEFGREDNDFLILLQGDNLPTENATQWFEELHLDLTTVPHVEHVQSLYNAPLINGTDGFLEITNAWVQPQPWQRINDQPLFRNLLSNTDGTTQVIQVRVDPFIEKVSDLTQVATDIQHSIERHPPPTGIELTTTGVPHIRTEIVDLMLADEMFYVPVTAVMFLLTIVWLFRGIRLALAPIAAVQISMGWAVGLLIVSGVTFNILSMLVPAISMVIGIADGIHLVSRYREERAHISSAEDALARTLAEMTSACFLTTFTTASGFASLLVADTVVIQDFGLHAAVAVSITFIGIMVIIPLWMRFLPDHVFEGPQVVHQQWTKTFTWLHTITNTHRRSIILFSTVLCIGAGYIASQSQANSYILEMYSDDHPTVQALHTIEDELSGIVPMFIYLEQRQSWMNPTDLKVIQEIQQFAAERDFVRWSTSISEQQSLIHHALTNEGQYSLPASEDMLAQEQLLTEMGGGIPNDAILSVDEHRTRILVLCKDIGGVDFLQFKSDLDDFIQSRNSDNRFEWRVTGDGMLASIGIDKLINDLLSSVGLVFVVILLVFAWMLRSTPHVLLAFIPNVLPLLMTLALLSLMGRDLQVSNIVSFTVAIGLAVDDTIHFVARYREERLAGHSHQLAMQRTMLGAGHAIVLTSILLICGFGLLSTSELTSTFYFGILTAITLISAIFADLLLLPAMFNWWESTNTEIDNAQRQV